MFLEAHSFSRTPNNVHCAWRVMLFSSQPVAKTKQPPPPISLLSCGSQGSKPWLQRHKDDNSQVWHDTALHHMTSLLVSSGCDHSFGVQIRNFCGQPRTHSKGHGMSDSKLWNIALPKRVKVNLHARTHKNFRHANIKTRYARLIWNCSTGAARGIIRTVKQIFPPLYILDVLPSSSGNASSGAVAGYCKNHSA
jgi:hypothetical protein